MGATPTIYARSRDRWRAYTSNNIAGKIRRCGSSMKEKDGT
jgi:hypothetical protein